MKTLRLFLATLWLLGALSWGAFTEFYMDASAGANINAGDLTANGVVTSTNGAWSTVTNIFTATGGTPFSGVTAGDFAALYADGGTVAVYISRVTAVGGGGLTLTLSTTAKAGVAPTTAGVAISCTTGGAWKGPNAAVTYPFNLATLATLNNAGSDQPRLNMKAGTNYAITAAVTSASAGPYVIEGYTTTAGDGGRATIDGGTTGASYIMLTISGNNVTLANIIAQNNGASGTSGGVVISGDECLISGVVVNSVRGRGLYLSGSNNVAEKCEAYACNQSNTAAFGGLAMAGTGNHYLSSISHDNTGSNGNGFYTTSAGGWIIGCIADTNAGAGFFLGSASSAYLRKSESYANTGNGVTIDAASTAPVNIEDCNLIDNGAYGIQGTGAGSKMGRIKNCGFGAGTAANGSGTTNALSLVTETGSVNYAADVTPWNAPTTGDFRISLAAAKGAGSGTFTQTAASYTGTIGYPDRGTAQHLEVASGGETTSVFVK